MVNQIESAGFENSNGYTQMQYGIESHRRWIWTFALFTIF